MNNNKLFIIIIGGIHFIYTIPINIYILFYNKNKLIEYAYLLFLSLMFLHWTYMDGDCFITKMLKNNTDYHDEMEFLGLFGLSHFYKRLLINLNTYFTYFVLLVVNYRSKSYGKWIIPLIIFLQTISYDISDKYYPYIPREVVKVTMIALIFLLINFMIKYY